MNNYLKSGICFVLLLCLVSTVLYVLSRPSYTQQQTVVVIYFATCANSDPLVTQGILAKGFAPIETSIGLSEYADLGIHLKSCLDRLPPGVSK